jgi:protein required for attachment to host cells
MLHQAAASAQANVNHHFIRNRILLSGDLHAAQHRQLEVTYNPRHLGEKRQVYTNNLSETAAALIYDFILRCLITAGISSASAFMPSSSIINNV